MNCPICKGTGRVRTISKNNNNEVSACSLCLPCMNCDMGYVTLWQWIKLKLGIK